MAVCVCALNIVRATSLHHIYILMDHIGALGHVVLLYRHIRAFKGASSRAWQGVTVSPLFVQSSLEPCKLS